MKNKFKYIAAAFIASAAMTSCADLDTEYLGGYVSTDQKQEVVNGNPDMAVAGVSGIFSQFNTYMSLYDEHFDFGYPALMLGLDLQTADMNCNHSGYNHFRYWQGFTSPDEQGTPAAYAWYQMYRQIKIENDLLASLDPTSDNEEIRFFRAQALATRSYNYWVLANLFQFNYKWHQDDLCVAIITDENSDEAAVNGAPRATVKEVFEQIMSDITAAIDILDNCTVNASQLIDSKPKRMISRAAAYGLRARYNLTMGKYADAAQDAQRAIATFDGSPYTVAQAGAPGFVNLDDNSWMWGIAISETDRVVTSGIVNFPSMISSLGGGGYTSVGVWKACAQDLYNSIPDTDVRKGWFLDDNWTSPNLSADQQGFLSNYVGSWTLGQTDAPYLIPHTNVKYGTYNNVLGQTVPAADIPMMRVEEMYYIKAEGQAMSGDVDGGRATLEAFVKEYRNPSYTCRATTADAMLEEIFQQRRVELWGEGLIYFDYLRLRKGVDRRNALCPDYYRYNIPAESPCLIYCIPYQEFNTNRGMAGQDNNERSDRPVALPL